MKLFSAELNSLKSDDIDYGMIYLWSFPWFNMSCGKLACGNLSHFLFRRKYTRTCLDKLCFALRSSLRTGGNVVEFLNTEINNCFPDELRAYINCETKNSSTARELLD